MTQVKDKFLYYNIKSSGIFSSNDRWYIDSWENYSKNFLSLVLKNCLTYLKKREHQLPTIIEDISSEIKKNLHKGFKFHSDEKIKKTVLKKSYTNYVSLANQINSLKNKNLLKKISYIVNFNFQNRYYYSVK